MTPWISSFQYIERPTLVLVNRWRDDWIQSLVECLQDPQRGRRAVTAFPWFNNGNGFDRSKRRDGEECLDLRGIHLSGADLTGADLCYVCLDHGTLEDVVLTEARMTHALLRNCTLNGVTLAGADLYQADLGSALLERVDLTEANCTRASFEKATFRTVKAQGTSFDSADFKDCTIQTLESNAATHFLGVNLQGTAFTHNPILKRTIEDQNWLEAKRQELCQTRIGSLLWWLWGATSDHGRSFFRWLVLSFAMALIYGFVYQFLPLHIRLQNINPILARFYFSVVTFTTLGFGDVLPNSNLAMLVVASEVILGYLMLGALISILADRFARRS